MSKTLGQIAFDRMQENPKMKMVWLWPWDQQSPWVQEAWEAAAQAVAQHIQKRGWGMSDALIDIAVIEDAEELREILYSWLPVIEAALDLLRISKHYRLESTEGKIAAAKVIMAAGALDKAEVG